MDNFMDIFKMFDRTVESDTEKAPLVGIALPWKGTQVRSLERLREQFDLDAAMSAFLDGTLEQWLKNCYYERECARVQTLDRNLSTNTKRRLCAIWGVQFSDDEALNAEQAKKVAQKQEILEKYTQDAQILSHAAETATDQGELAELLDQGVKTIYLCDGSFYVPIRKGGVHYIGVGTPVMLAPFTQEQYRKAGVTLEGVILPETSDDDTAAAARQAAISYGYDDFAETHSKLASLLRDGMKCGRFLLFPKVTDGEISVSFKEYKSRYAALQAGHKAVNKAYDKANEFFSPGSAQCLALPTSRYYAQAIHKAADGYAQRLRSWSKGDLRRENILRELSRLVDNCEEELRNKLEDELRDSADYYQMYDRSYFLDKVEVEMFDYAITGFESGLLNALSSMIQNDREYILTGLAESIEELQKDLLEHAQNYFDTAFGIFEDYRRQIEDLAEELGKDLSDQELTALGIAV